MSPILKKLNSLYQLEVRAMQYAQDGFLLLIRLYWGWQFFLTGRGKLMNIERTAEFFGSLGIPLPTLNAYAAGATECFGGLLLLAGIASRISTIPLIGTMCVAYLTAHGEQLRAIVSNPDAFVTAPPFLFLLAAVIVLLFGPGRLSVDALAGPYLLRKLPNQRVTSETESASQKMATAASQI